MANPCVLRTDVARARLATLGLTQSAAAERCGVEVRTLQRWFAGGRASLADAERLAAALGIGTGELFEGSSTGVSPFSRVRAAMRVLGLREGALTQALRVMLEHFEFVDRHVSLSAHPAQGFVQRVPVSTHSRFAVLRLAFPDDEDTHVTFCAQVARSFRYEFGEVDVRRGEAVLCEHFHTRCVRAELGPQRTLDVWVWISPEMRELVTIAGRDVRVTMTNVDEQLFDLRREETRHAVCFRPATMHLRAAGLSPVFDRVVGPRDGRVDALTS